MSFEIPSFPFTLHLALNTSTVDQNYQNVSQSVSPCIHFSTHVDYVVVYNDEDAIVDQISYLIFFFCDITLFVL